MIYFYLDVNMQSCFSLLLKDVTARRNNIQTIRGHFPFFFFFVCQVSIPDFATVTKYLCFTAKSA